MAQLRIGDEELEIVGLNSPEKTVAQRIQEMKAKALGKRAVRVPTAAELGEKAKSEAIREEIRIKRRIYQDGDKERLEAEIDKIRASRYR